MNGLEMVKEIEIDTDGARTFVSNRKYNNNWDLVCEIYGSLPGRANKISIDILNGFLIVSGNDGGLMEDDLFRLTKFFNSSKKGHSEHGVGVRVACRELVKKSDKDFFYVVDGENGIKYLYDREQQDIRKYSDMNKDEAFEIFQNYRAHIENNLGGDDNKRMTKWIVPINSEFTDEENLTTIVDDIKKRFSSLIYNNNNFKFYFKGEEIKLQNKYYECENWDSVEILTAKLLQKNGSPGGNSNDFFRIKDKVYDKDCNEKKLEDLYCRESKSTLHLSYFNPTSEQVDLISDEYGINKTKYNGILISKKNVLISTNFVLAKGQREAGTAKDQRKIICIKSPTDDLSTVMKTSTEKNTKPELLNSIKTLTSVYIKLNSNKQIKPPKPKPFTQLQKDELLRELMEFQKDYDSERYQKYNSRPRCLMCDKFLNIFQGNKTVAGHILAACKGGEAELNNGMIICSGCNNCDIRSIPEACWDDYGYDHPNTLRVKKYFEVYNKDCQSHFSKSNQSLK